MDFGVDEENYSESDDGSSSDSSPTTNLDSYKDLSKSSENETNVQGMICSTLWQMTENQAGFYPMSKRLS